MARKLYESLGFIGVLFQPALFALVFKYVLLEGWAFPFYLVSALNLGSVVGALAVLTYLSLTRDNTALTDKGAGQDVLLLIGTLQMAYICLSAYALHYPGMTLIRYFVSATFFDCLFSGLGSTFLLSRSLSNLHWIATLLAALGYILQEFVQVKASSLSSLQNKAEYEATANLYKDEGWIGPMCLLFARLAYCLRGLLHKRSQLSRDFRKKMWLLSRRLALEESFPINQEYLEDNELVCPRRVSTLSATYQWCTYLRNVKRLTEEYNRNQSLSLSNNQAVTVGVDDYVKYLLEVEEYQKKRKGELIKQTILNDIEPTSNSLYRHFFYLRNKVYKDALGLTQPSGSNFTTDALGKALPTIPTFDPSSFAAVHTQQYEHVPAPSWLYHRTKLSSVVQDNKMNAYREDKDSFAHLLENVLNESQSLLLHAHLFTGYNDLYLSKLDMIYGNSAYDTELFEFSEEGHYILCCVTTILPVFLAAPFLAMATNEVRSFYDCLEASVGIGSGGGIALVITMSVIVIPLPYLHFHSIMALSTTRYPWLALGMNVLWLALASTFVEGGRYPIVPSMYIFTLCLAVIAQCVCLGSSCLSIDFLRTASAIEFAKAAVTSEFKTKEEVDQFAQQAQQIDQLLGAEMCYSTLLDAVVTRYKIDIRD